MMTERRSVGAATARLMTLIARDGWNENERAFGRT